MKCGQIQTCPDSGQHTSRVGEGSVRVCCTAWIFVCRGGVRDGGGGSGGTAHSNMLSIVAAVKVICGGRSVAVEVTVVVVVAAMVIMFVVHELRNK